MENGLVDVVLRPERLFDHALPGHDEQIPVPRLGRQNGDGALILCGIVKQIVERIALIRELARDLFTPDAVTVAQIRDDDRVLAREHALHVADNEPVCRVRCERLVRRHRVAALADALEPAVRRDAQNALDAGCAHILPLGARLFDGVDQFGATGRLVRLSDLQDLLFDDLELPALAVDDRGEVFDELLEPL